MTRIKSLFASALLAATVAVVPVANAQTVHFVGAGSSAQWQAFALAAFNDLATPLGNAGHWTAKGKTTAGNPVAFLADPRNSQTNPIPNEPGNIWIVWGGGGGGTPTDVWTDLSVDSVVGNRAFFAAAGTKTAPVYGATVNVDASLNGTAGQNAIAAILWADNANDGVLPNSVFTAVTGKHVNVALTDIRPEDAQYATKRALTAFNALSLAGLGYNHGPNAHIGNPILSSQAGSSAKATPVAFSLHGTDPISRITVRGNTTIPVGAAPIVFFINNNGGTFPATNAVTFKKVGTKNTYPLANVFDGTDCSSGAVAFGGSGNSGTAITAILREPLSGTMNTTEFTTFRRKLNAKDSQEKGITDTTAAPFNPLSLACSGSVGGSRSRAIGTGEEINGATGGGVKGTANSIGYAFFGYGNFSKLAGLATYNYLTLDGVDPINNTYTTGLLPACPGPCAATPGASFPHLRDGSYSAWSLYRAVADPADPQLANIQALVQKAQDDVNSTIPDFVPFHTTDNSDGLDVYRSHYLQSTIAGNNGALSTSLQGNTLGGTTEAGGDMGGCIEKNPAGPPGVLNCKQ